MAEVAEMAGTGGGALAGGGAVGASLVGSGGGCVCAVSSRSPLDPWKVPTSRRAAEAGEAV